MKNEPNQTPELLEEEGVAPISEEELDNVTGGLRTPTMPTTMPTAMPVM